MDKVRSVIRFQKSDRPPVIPELIAVTATMAGVSPKDYVRSGQLIAECQLDARRKIGHDALFAMADLCVEAEAVGCAVKFPEDNYPHIKNIVIREVSDLKHIGIPNPKSDGRMPELLKAVRLLKKNSRGEVPVMAHVTGPLTIASRIMDIEKMLYMIVDHPNQFRSLLDFCLDVSLTFAAALLKEGADGIIVFDPTASPFVLSEKIFKEFELNPLRVLFSKIRETNPEAIRWYSVAGPVQDNFSILGSVSADISTIDYMVPIETAMRYSSSTVINGNIKPNLFIEGNNDDILKEAAGLLAATRSMERFILGSGCEVPLYSKAEKIALLVEAAERERYYFNNINEPAEGLQEIAILPHRKRIYSLPGSTMLEAVREAGISITSYCHPSGSCGKCVVRINKGKPASPEKIEKLQLETQANHPDDRLACYLKIQGPMEIYIPYKNRIFRHQLEVPDELYDTSVNQKLQEKGLAPNIVTELIDISDLQNMNPTSYDEWISSKFDSFQAAPGLIGKLLPLVLIKIEKAFGVLDLNRREIIDFSRSDNNYGLALDIGTTTISAYLHDLQNGELKCVGLAENSQSQWGLDVITRATNTIQDPSLLPKMQEKLVEEINGIIAYFHDNYSIPSNKICDITIVANPVITQLFLGLSPESISQSPFTPGVSDWVSTSANSMGTRPSLAVNRNCRIEILPSIGGFVGSDIVAGILATGVHKEKEVSLFIDIGTNGEIVLGNCDRLLCTSVAAGPAFEGAHLSHGHPYQNGIIHTLEIDGNGEIRYETLGGAAPIGLCGSSFIDAMAAFISNGIIDNRGHFVKSKRWPQIKNNMFVLVPKHNTATFNPIGITAKDVEEIQKAKSAIRTGIDLLIREMNISPDIIRNVFVSGSFGFVLNIENAKNIGMIPDLPSAEFHLIKNSAGIGSRLALLSRKARKECEEIALFTKHVNLAHHIEYNDCFIDNMLFPVSS
ncbi:MAG: ASKHA domain-containing protein [Nitrospinota bacterium]